MHTRVLRIIAVIPRGLPPIAEAHYPALGQRPRFDRCRSPTEPHLNRPVLWAFIKSIAERRSKAAAKKRTTMTHAHKKALAAGREQGRAVRDYLEWLEYSKPTRGRKRDTSPERIAQVETEIAETTSAIRRLELIQLRKDLEAAADVDDDPREAEQVRNGS